MPLPYSVIQTCGRAIDSKIRGTDMFVVSALFELSIAWTLFMINAQGGLRTEASMNLGSHVMALIRSQLPQKNVHRFKRARSRSLEWLALRASLLVFFSSRIRARAGRLWQPPNWRMSSAFSRALR